MNVFNGWRNKKAENRIVEDSKPADPKTVEVDRTMQNGFAELCLTHVNDEAQKKIVFKKGLEDFIQLLRDSRLQYVAVNLSAKELLLGTVLVRLEDQQRKRHRIGEFIITLAVAAKTYTFHNLTPFVSQEWSESYHHPHMNPKGHMCITSGSERIKAAIADGDLLQACHMLLTVVFTVNEVGQYVAANVRHWPLDETQE